MLSGALLVEPAILEQKFCKWLLIVNACFLVWGVGLKVKDFNVYPCRLRE